MPRTTDKVAGGAIAARATNPTANLACASSSTLKKPVGVDFKAKRSSIPFSEKEPCLDNVHNC
ncbi:hypothetical protein BPAE_0229g00060 [Botrytis paeoniae]|uniref:Uncharacterized protein n=1 Tax=Botrytis paeoniae TaxID=278948 RepID=A0A4Z1F9I0_9HELO|nr:hypothetical protein BPAE_0229g00060 [Botrytis paeoniae]